METQDVKPIDENKRKNHYVMKSLIALGVLIVVLLLLLHSCGNLCGCSCNCNCKGECTCECCTQTVDAPSYDVSVDANSGVLHESSKDDLIKELNEKVKQGEINMSMNTYVVFEDGNSTGNFKITNNEVNNYPQMVEIFLNDTNEVVYRSGLIPIGKTVEHAKLTTPLEKGVYNATARFFNMEVANPEDTDNLQATPVGEARVEIQLNILN